MFGFHITFMTRDAGATWGGVLQRNSRSKNFSINKLSLCCTKKKIVANCLHTHTHRNDWRRGRCGRGTYLATI